MELVVVPANMTVGHGSSMIMSCVAAVDGNGVEPIISWSLNGRTISTNNSFTTNFIISSKVIYKQELQGVMFVMSTLRVCGADVDKVGIYSCRAATSGESDAEYWTVDMHDAEEAELIFVSNSSSLPGLGDMVVLSCTASGFPLPTITFSKDGDDIETTKGSSTRVSDIVFSVTVLKTSSTSFIFSSIQICITEIDVYGQYSCTARNGIGSPQTHTWSLIPNSSGLEIAIAPASQTVKVGATVLMACVAYGFPYPDITFSKDGTALAWYNSNSISVTEMVGVEDSMAYSLSLISICNVEQGRYSCNARSDKETHTVSWDIIYENILLLTTTTTSKAPIVIELPAELVVVPLDTQTVDHGSTVIISCVANGSPSPAITWSKGGTALTNSTTGGVKIYNRRINEGKFKLVQSNLVICGLREQDTSLYKCEAANSIGKDYFDWELDVLPTSEKFVCVCACETLLGFLRVYANIYANVRVCVCLCVCDVYVCGCVMCMFVCV